ncbi:eIF-2-alpha kinase activator GCN1 [Chionoecetes opilio]|uniref:eIF-2-alpha kinase activator GCN1 n=1 Tax=Chionoecetes opilio TaxID=41210 RepID=A0A8J4Y2F1_CHIOP|nr:eIF-2-alpha kinase activator GCN1 [Chionoecetes opilio]
MILGGHLLHLMAEKKITSPVDTLKATLIQVYVKQVLQSKNKAWQFVLEQTCPLLRQLNHQEFSDIVLPVAKKSLLRNPEVTLKAVAYLCSGLNLDLSKYLEDIIKTLASPLHAKEDQVREDTVEVCRQLARQCSDAAPIEKFIALLFDVFFGSDGKLTATTHKISVLQGIEGVSEHCVTGSSAQALSVKVLDRMTKVLETESHEGTLLQALTALSAWTAKFTNDIPQKLIDFVPKGMTLKTSTASIRAAYVRCLQGCVTSSSAHKATPVITHLITSIEKALNQITQIPVLVEALTSCVLLLRLSAVDVTLEQRVAPIWSTAMDLQKGYFTGDKFLAQASDEGLLQLVMCCELLVSQHNERLGKDISLVHQALVWCLVCPHSRVRLAAQTSTKKLVSGLGGTHLATDLLNTLTTMTMNNKIQSQLKKSEEQDTGGGSGGGELSPAGVAQALITVCSPSTHDRLHKEQLALLALRPAFHPSLAQEYPNLWEQVCRSMGLAAVEVITSQQTTLIRQFTTDFKPSPIDQQVFSGLCRLAGHVVLPPVTAFINSRLNNPKLVQVSDEDYAIYLTPEGTLHNQRVVEQAFEDHLNIKNVKKSNKVYSHKEQMMMLEEKKRELEKKRKEGRLELTPKQKEVLRAQTEKENSIRNRVRELSESTKSSIALLEAAIVGNVEDLSPHFTVLIPLLTWALRSHLVGPQMCDLFIKLRSAVFEQQDDVYAHTLARTTVRVCEPVMKLPEDWLGENIMDAAFRTLRMIHTATVPKQYVKEPMEGRL